MTDPRVTAFVSEVLLPAFTEIAASPRMLRDFTIHVYRDAIDDPMHATLVTELARERAIGPVLLVEDRDQARRPPPFGGRYLAAPMFRVDDAIPDQAAILASPVVMFQMQFDRELHVFHQRYSALSEVPVEKITRAMIQNHVLNSFSFFRIHAMSPARPW
jgi:hypothetical protein